MQATQQQVAIMDCVRQGHDVSVNAGPGCGKGLRSDQPVITPKGYVSIGNLKQGDLVYGSDGKSYPVIGVYHRGIQPLYKVTFNDGQSVITDGDHRWLCHTLYERKKKKGMFVRTTNTLIEMNVPVFLPMPKPVTGTRIDLNIDPWLLGALLGDGGLTGRSVRFTNTELSILDAVEKLIPSEAKFVFQNRYTWSINGNGSGKNNVVAIELRNLGLMGCGSHEKFIPEFILNADYETRLAVMNGLLDTDGYTDGYHLEYSTSSKQLGNDFRRLVESFGGLCTMTEKESHYTKNGERIKCKTSYRFLVRLPSGVLPFRYSEKKALRYVEKTKYQPSKQIVSIVPVNKGESVCIEVGSDDHLFMTVGHTLTHNTATLNLLAKDRPGTKIINFCFNRTTKLQADTKMPAWTKNMTFHGAAYAYCGKYYAKKLNIKINPQVIAERFGCDLHTATVAKYTVRRYATSDDNVIVGYHVPKEAVLSKDMKDRETFKEDVVTIARKLWLAAMDFKNHSIGCEHDFYLKRWVEEGAKLNGQFDVVMVDEGQDMVPVNIKAMQRIYGQKIIVGDKNQQLYQWRNAINSLTELNLTYQLHLTASFRFGPRIAEVANQVLDLLDPTQPKLQGVSSFPSEVRYGTPDTKHVVLCRSNAGLLGETLNAVRKGKSIHVVGSLMDSILLMESAWYLSIGEKHQVRHPTMQLFNDWNAVVDMAKEDGDLAQAVKRVDEYGGQIPYLCEELRASGETSYDRADVVLSTVHKFKGMEAPVIKLGEDYPDLVQWRKKERKYVPMKGELCVYFVAVTRAMQTLYANSTLPQLKSWKELID